MTRAGPNTSSAAAVKCVRCPPLVLPHFRCRTPDFRTGLLNDRTELTVAVRTVFRPGLGFPIRSFGLIETHYLTAVASEII
jgi:hypothetical protein